MASKNNGRYPNRLRELRKNAGYSQAEIAKLIGIGQSGYSSMETMSVELQPNRIEKLCEIFNCSKEDLYPPVFTSVPEGSNVWVCADDAMIPVLEPGDVVAYESVSDWRALENKDIVIIRVDGDLCVRSVTVVDGIVYLTPAIDPLRFESYKVFLRGEDEQPYMDDPIELVGVCTQFTRKL